MHNHKIAIYLYILKFVYFYLFEWQSDRNRELQRQKYSVDQFTVPMSTTAKVEPVWSQDLGTSSRPSMWVAKIQVLKPLSAASQGAHQQESELEVEAGLDAKHSDMGYKCPKPQLNLLCHS